MVKIQFNFEIKSPTYYYVSLVNYIGNKIERTVAKIRQSDRIDKLEEQLKKAEREARDYFDLSVEEEKKAKKANYDKTQLESRLNKICNGNSCLKEILNSPNKMIDVLAKCLPPKRERQAKLKISKKHPRHQRYKDFLTVMADLDFVTDVIDKEAKQAKSSRVKIRGNEILVTYLDDHTHRKSYHASIKTTAENEGQLYVIARLIENYLPKLGFRNNKP